MKKNFTLPKTSLFLAITFIFLFIYLPYPLFGKAFIVGWDMRTIYSSNFENLRTVLHNLIENGTNPFWTWFSFLGNDFYSSKLFYFNDFFEIPFALTSMKYDDAIMWMTYIKFLIIGFSFYAYVRYNKYSTRTAFLTSLIYTFSSYQLYVMPQPFFASFFTFLPLYFLSVDRYILEGKPGMFTGMVCFMFMNNYYQFYSVSLFTILYYIYRWYHEYHSFDSMMKYAFRLISFYLLGLLMSGIVVLPEVLNILSNSRIGNRSSFLFYESILPYVDYLCGLFLPASAFAFRGTPITNLFTYVTPNDSVMNVWLWSSSIVSLLFPQLFTKRNRNKLTIFSVCLISVFALVPILSSILHGFSEPSFRWLASPLFLLFFAILPIVEEPERINKRLLGITCIILAILMVITPSLIAILVKMDLNELWASDGFLMFIFLPTFFLTFYCIYKEKRKVLILSTIAELCLVSYLSFYGSPGLSNISKGEYDRITTIMGNKGDYTRFTKEIDITNEESFYRSYIDPTEIYWDYSTSLNLDFDIMGLLAYDSTYLPSMNDLVKLDKEHVQHYLPWTFHITNPDILNLVSTKYAVVLNEETVPFHRYEKVAEYAMMSVYENLDYVNLGKTYTKLMTYDDYSPSQSSVLNDTIIVHAEDKDAIEPYLGTSVEEIESVTLDGNYVYAYINAKQAGFAVLSIPYDKGWHVTVNETDVPTFCVSGGMTGIPLVQGKNHIEFSFTPRGLKLGILASVVGIILYAELLILKLRKK